MDAAGKDSTIKHVMSGVNPQGVQVYSFKAPSAEELDHDYIWRSVKALPERGRIGIHNRSYYEEVLVVRVHKAILESQRLPAKCLTKHIWDERFEDIRNYERHLWRNGTIIRKFFLNVSRKEQRRRFLERIDDPAKNWKFRASDLDTRARWDEYHELYEAAISATSTDWAQWYVVPADHRWVRDVAVASILVEVFEAPDPRIPDCGPGLAGIVVE
jgi:PPK2 family polyphosphate:nucleotide phosphotransferase